MVKFICDICQKEFDVNGNHAEMIIQEESFGFLKHQKVPQVRKINYIFCQDCGKNMQEQKKVFQKLSSQDADKQAN